jgi:hypothetical protein
MEGSLQPMKRSAVFTPLWRALRSAAEDTNIMGINSSYVKTGEMEFKMIV